MLHVGIVGASGYTGAELARILVGHPEVRITVATSRQYAGKALAEVFPHLRKRVDVVCENLSPPELIDRADLFFTAVPHQTAMEIVPQLLDAGKKVIDL
ncbi:MAG: NAD(P)-binding domain-containing protein, partial [Candidatus Darwinibacter acetoxidans]